MKRILLLSFCILLSTSVTFSQTKASDFTMNDCNGTMHNLFTELNTGKVIIMEFFMLNCGSCIAAADEIHPMYNQLSAKHPGKVEYYVIGYTNSYNCTNIKNWVNTNAPGATPFDSGAVQTAYYGGMGMPTIAVVGGSGHDVLFTNTGYSSGDTATIATAINNFFKSSGIQQQKQYTQVNLSPNPANNQITLSGFMATTTKTTLTIVNALGQTVSEWSFDTPLGTLEKMFDISQLSAGIYSVNINVSNSMITQKLVISHY